MLKQPTFPQKKNDIIQFSGIVEFRWEIIDKIDIRMQPEDYKNISEKELEIQGVSIDFIKAYSPANVDYFNRNFIESFKL